MGKKLVYGGGFDCGRCGRRVTKKELEKVGAGFACDKCNVTICDDCGLLSKTSNTTDIDSVFFEGRFSVLFNTPSS